MSANEIDNDTHPCAGCGASISNRHAMRTCARCSIRELHATLETEGYFMRQEARRLREAEEEDRERMRAKGLL